MKSTFIFFLSYFITLTSLAQRPQFVYMGDKLGLPSQECYNILQDKNGYIWIATDAGLCRYNGATSKIFNKTNGLPENSCYVINESCDSKLWFITSKNRILNYHNDSLKESEISSIYHNSNKDPKLVTYYFHKDSQGNYWVKSQLPLCKIYKNKIVSQLIADSSIMYTFNEVDNELLPNENNFNLDLRQKAIRTQTATFTIKSKKGFKRYTIPLGMPSLNWRILTARDNSGGYFISINNTLIAIDSNLNYSTKTLPGIILNLHKDKDDGLWIGMLKSGYYYYPSVKNLNLYYHGLEELSISSIFVDHESGVWCTSLEKGVYYCKNKDLISYENIDGLNKKSDMLALLNNRLFYSSLPNQVLSINLTNNKIDSHHLTFRSKYPISDIVSYENKLLLLGSDFLIAADTNLKKFAELVDAKTKVSFSGKEILFDKDNALLLHTNGLFKLKKTNSTYALQDKFSLPGKGNCFIKMNDSIYMIGTNENIVQYNSNSNAIATLNSIIGNVVKIIKSKKAFWILTKDNGAYLYLNNKVQRIASLQFLNNLRINDAIFDENNNIWIATNNGIYIINANSNTITHHLIEDYLIPSKEILKLKISRQDLYIVTIDGLSKLPVKSVFKTIPSPHIFLNNIITDESNNLKEQRLSLDYYYKKLTFSFDVITFKDFGNPIVFCELKKDDKQIRLDTIKGCFYSLINLNPGNYTLTISSSKTNIDGEKNKVIFPFSVQKPFWLNWGFLVLVIVIILFGIYGVIKIISKKIKLKETEKTKINKLLSEYQLSAIQSQMNPHFIFNSINSIQSYILEKSKEEAYDYLAKFGKLIRMVLVNSEHKTISLAEEIEWICIYIELEQLRFDKKFDFLLSIDSKLNLDDIVIPTMLIQPYIENAIWHGIMNIDSTKTGKLILDLKIEADKLIVTVEDNGVGRSATEKYKENSLHKSVGMKLTKKRIDLINKIENFEGTKVVVTDLYHEVKPIGTRVEIIATISNQ